MDCVYSSPKQNIVRHAMLNRIKWAATTIRCVAPFCEDQRKVSFPKTQRSIASFRNWNASRQPCSFQFAFYSAQSCIAAVVAILAFKFFFKNATKQYVHSGHRTRNSTIAIRRSNRLSYAAAFSLILLIAHNIGKQRNSNTISSNL